VPYYRRVGEVPRKRHTLVKRPGGEGFLAEELIGQEGFAQESALLYHQRSPSAIVAVGPAETPPGAAERDMLTPEPVVVPHHLRTTALAVGGDPVRGRHRLVGNDDVVLSYVRAVEDSPLYRNASGDELVYVHEGEAIVETSFGVLDVAAGDYVVLPAAVTHRWVLRSDRLELLVLEAGGHVRFPDRYVTGRGQLREGAPFSERDVRGPTEPLVVDGEDVEVLVRTPQGVTRMVHAHHPFDVVGWDGCLYPHALSIHDFEPIVGAIHQPPPVHQTFAGPNFVVCSFVPRPYDFHPEATKVPYHHSNVDSHEVIFYAAGDFMSRAGSGIGPGSISWHPPGFVHGPQPGSIEAAMEQARTEELAVMIDTFRPLLATATARGIADADYAWTWSRER